MLSKTAAAHYLAAMIDGEGTVSVQTSNSRLRTVRIANTDWALIEAVTECCDVLGIEYRVESRSTKSRPSHWKPAWNVVIATKAGLQRLLESVHLRAPSKQTRLRALVASYKPNRRPTRNALIKMYIEQKMSLAMIMRETGARSTATVKRWLQSENIKSRSLSEAASLDWRRRRLHAVP